MSCGVLIFATNNGTIDYEAMAAWSAANIKRHLGLPTHVVTGSTIPDANSRSFPGLGQVSWFNQGRPDAYDLSPWDQTLVLDADYVVASDQLLTVLASHQDFLAHRWAHDVTGLNDFTGLNWFGAHRMPMWWATVIMFRRSAHVGKIFHMMRMVRDNWSHYRDLYKIRQHTYRNDHALTIALLVCNGHWLDHAAIPWSLPSVMPEHDLTQISQDRYRLDFQDSENRDRWIELAQDFHAMGKPQLERIVANPS